MLCGNQSLGAGAYVSSHLQERYRMGINTLFCPQLNRYPTAFPCPPLTPLIHDNNAQLAPRVGNNLQKGCYLWYKVKFTLEHSTKAHMSSRCIALLFL